MENNEQIKPNTENTKTNRLVKQINLETFIALACVLVFFGMFMMVMGPANMFKTMMSTAHDLIVNTILFIMGLAVVAGAFSAIISEFGITSIINKILTPIMKPIFNLPGVASLGIITTYLSDNPAIISLAYEEDFKKFFKQYQMPALTNLGTSFGMGLIVSTFMIAQAGPGQNFATPVLIGNIGAFIGSIVSVRLMLIKTKKVFPIDNETLTNQTDSSILKYRSIRDGSVMQRILSAILDGGKSGVDLGLSVIPGVVIICTFVMMLTNGPSADGTYTGAAYEGIKLLPWIGDKLNFILRPLLGFESPEAIAFPITSLGAVGAAISLVPNLLRENLISANEIAVFTAMGMCWSGYLSTHIAMMDALKMRNLTNSAIVSHTIGGLVAGISAHFIYLLVSLFL